MLNDMKNVARDRAGRLLIMLSIFHKTNIKLNDWEIYFSFIFTAFAGVQKLTLNYRPQ